MSKLADGILTAAFTTACIAGVASGVGIVVGLTAAPALLPAAAAIELGSIVVGGTSGIALVGRGISEFINNF